MTDDANSLAERFGPLLVQREADLRASLESVQGNELADEQASSSEVRDFKDMACRDVQASMNAMDVLRTADELAQVQAARRRLQQGSFGRCVQCGQDIDLRRLEALPATPLCLVCQTATENAQTLHGDPGTPHPHSSQGQWPRG